MRNILFLIFLSAALHAGDGKIFTLQELDSFFENCSGTPSEFAVRTGKTWNRRSAYYRLNPSAIQAAIDTKHKNDAAAQKRIRSLSDDIRRGLDWKLPQSTLEIPFFPQ